MLDEEDWINGICAIVARSRSDEIRWGEMGTVL